MNRELARSDPNSEALHRPTLGWPAQVGHLIQDVAGQQRLGPLRPHYGLLEVLSPASHVTGWPRRSDARPQPFRDRRASEISVSGVAEDEQRYLVMASTCGTGKA